MIFYLRVHAVERLECFRSHRHQRNKCINPPGKNLMMKTKPALKKLFGSFLLFAACSLAFLWFYWFAPFRHVHSPKWMEACSMQRRWIEEQKQIHRTGADHDSSISVGRFGDKVWTEWVIRKINSGKKEDQDYSCGDWPYHLPDAPATMTNQRLTNDAAWLGWWKINKSKTQVEWIREGFAQKGIILHQPLTTNDITTLFKLIGATNIRSHLRYNAERWLRDSGVSANQVHLKEVPIEDQDQIARGLVRYAFWHGEHWNAPGFLKINEESMDASLQFGEAMIERAPVKLTIIGLLIAIALSGMFLLRRQLPK